jgi:hypothetical protein
MIVQSDLLIKTAISHVIEEVRKNPWLVDDILSELTCDPLLSSIYGKKEIDNAKEWLASNKIEILLKYRNDNAPTPYISITLGASTEANEYATMSDSSTETVDLEPSEIQKPIAYVVKPFDIQEYIPESGAIRPPDSVSLLAVADGMFLVDPDTGNAYEIKKSDENFIYLVGNPVINIAKAGVIPKYRHWRARVEQAWFKENYSIGCHVHGDPAPLLWLHSILLYGMLRYRESLFEARGLQISSISSTDLVDRTNSFDNPSGEQVFSRWITLSGVVKNTWIKSPKRIIESLVLGEKGEDSYISGVKVISCSSSKTSKAKKRVYKF